MQGSKLYVGNLNYSVTEKDLTQLFSNYGKVMHVNIVKKDKNFGFVTMSNQAEAEKAKEALDNFKLKGRNLRVDEASPLRKRKKRWSNWK